MTLSSRLVVINYRVYEPLPAPDLATQPSLPLTRREQIVAAAARLFADRGFHGVTIEELGAAVGISGPGVYKHFANKGAVLADMLIGISEHLLTEGRRQVAESSCAAEALRRLLAFHTTFALTKPDLIRVQDRDLANLSSEDARHVRRLQRAYVELWAKLLAEHDTALSPNEVRVKVHGVFGLLNSTPHSAARQQEQLAGAVLRQMARDALGL